MSATNPVAVPPTVATESYKMEFKSDSTCSRQRTRAGGLSVSMTFLRVRSYVPTRGISIMMSWRMREVLISVMITWQNWITWM